MATETRSQEIILDVRNLTTQFDTEQGSVTAVDQVSFSLERGKTLCLVGESGCGKSVTSLSILRLVPEPPGRITGGEIHYQGKDLLSVPISDMRSIRGKEISMIFQEPMSSLNPVFTIGDQIREAIEHHQKISKKEAFRQSVEMLGLVGIPSPEKRAHDYPHQLSGGMRQRVMIAMALSSHPKILIADEPTTALDVTIQAQILELLKSLQTKLGMSILLITHDLGVVAEMADEVAVMYAGKIVEKAPVKELFKTPRHPYTRGLLKSMPRLNAEHGGQQKRLEVIPGIVPSLAELPKGCRFHTRCGYVEERCKEREPELRKPTGSVNGFVRCVRDF